MKDFYVVDSILNDCCVVPSFLCIIFTNDSTHGDNSRKIQLIDSTGSVIGFEDYPYYTHEEQPVPPNLIGRKIRVGDNAIFSIQLEKNTHVSGNARQVLGELKRKKTISSLINQAPMVAFYLADLNRDQVLKKECLNKSLELEREEDNPDFEGVLEAYFEADLYSKTRSISLPAISYKFNKEKNSTAVIFLNDLRVDEEKVIRPALVSLFASNLWANQNVRASYFRKGRLNILRTKPSKSPSDGKKVRRQMKFKMNGFFISALKEHYRYTDRELANFLGVSVSIIRSNEARKHKALGSKLQNLIHETLADTSVLLKIWETHERLTVERTQATSSINERSLTETIANGGLKKNIRVKVRNSINIVSPKSKKHIGKINKTLFGENKCRFIGVIRERQWVCLIFNNTLEWDYSEVELKNVVFNFPLKAKEQVVLLSDRVRGGSSPGKKISSLPVTLQNKPRIVAVSQHESYSDTFVVISQTKSVPESETLALLELAENLLL